MNLYYFSQMMGLEGAVKKSQKLLAQNKIASIGLNQVESIH